MNRLGQAIAALVAIVVTLPLGALAADGIYVGASVGSAGLNDDFDGLHIDRNSTAVRVASGWRFNENFSVEIGYHDFGDFEQSVDINGTLATVSLSADGFTIGVGGAIPVSDRFSLTGRLGWFFWNGSAEINSVSQATPEDNNLYFGVGVSYSLMQRFSLNSDWSRYDLDQTESNVLSAGFRYQFGQ